ncbi:MAG TPA: alpha/beta fold hydrolase [Longimicrobium sp.]
MITIRTLAPSAALTLAAALAPVSGAAQQPSSAAPTLELRPCTLPRGGVEARCGTYMALENREQPGGRRIPLDVVVVPARNGTPRPDPIFFVVGGPGQTGTELAPGLAGSPLNQDREIVFVDQRGTSPAHRLDCRLPGNPDNPQGYLEPIFVPEVFRACRRELESKADLTRYTTADYVDDLDEVRRALGYGQINVHGGSYGSRVVLFYMRQYPQGIRTGYMTGLYPASMRNPLYHAADSQAALDSIFALCARDAGCGGAFPTLRREFAETMDRLRRQPARVTIDDPRTRRPIELSLNADAFAEGVRVMMYNWDRSRRLPLLLHRAHGGEYGPFASMALASNAGIRDQLRFGLLMSAICSEDMPRITEEDIVRETRDTFLGDLRVRTQRAACAEWPRRTLPAGYADPVRSNVPALLVSGAYDPATAPRWGTVAAQTLPNAVHVVVPGGHTANSPCVERMVKELMDRGTTQGLDTSCVREIPLAPFVLSEEQGQ